LNAIATNQITFTGMTSQQINSDMFRFRRAASDDDDVFYLFFQKQK